jgi:hypothetical protein
VIYNIRTASLEIDGAVVAVEYRPVSAMTALAVADAPDDVARFRAMLAACEAACGTDLVAQLTAEDIGRLWRLITSPPPKG